MNILDPLGMNDTGYEEYDSNVSGLIPGSDPGQKVGDISYSSLLYCGGMYSTVNDLRKWCSEFTNAKILPKWYIANPLGWELKTKKDSRIQYHFGNLFTYSALAMIIRDKPNYCYIVLSNEGNVPMNPSIRMMADYLCAKKIGRSRFPARPIFQHPMLFGDDGRRYLQTRTDRVFLEVSLKRQVQYLPTSSAAHDVFFGKEGPGRKTLLRSGKRVAGADMLLKKSRLPGSLAERLSACLAERLAVSRGEGY